MSSKGLSPRLAAGMYIAAGVLFVVGALASGRIAFSGVGIAFVALGAVMLAPAQAPGLNPSSGIRP